MGEIVGGGRSLLDSARPITRQILAENLRDSLEEPSTPAEDVPFFDPSPSLSVVPTPAYRPSSTPPELALGRTSRTDGRPGIEGQHSPGSRRKFADNASPVNSRRERSGDEAHESPSSSQAPDGGYGWVIVAAVFMIHVILDGVTFSFSMLLPSILEEFHASKGSASSVNSILMGTTFFCGPLATVLTSKFGHRTVAIVCSIIAFLGCALSSFSTQVWHLALTYGFLIGLGFGGIYLPAIVSVATWFDKRRATAMGIAVCGTGVGVFLFSNLISYCLEKYTLQGCLLIESGVIFHVLLAAALLRPLESAQQKPAKRLEKGAAHVEMESLTSSSGRKEIKETKEKSGWQAVKALPFLRIWQYWVMLVVVFLCGISGYVPFTFISHRAELEGDVPRDQTQHLLSITGGLNLVGRLLAGILSDRKFVNRKILYSSAYIISGLATCFSVWCNDFTTFALYGSVYGFTGGIIIALQSVILTDIVGIDNLSAAFGISLFVLGFAAFAGPPMAGSLTEWYRGDYRIPFVVFGIIIGIGGLIFLVIPFAEFYNRLFRKEKGGPSKGKRLPQVSA